MILEVLQVVAPVLLITAIGFGWTRGGGRFDNQTISSLVMFVGTPCLVFSTLTRVQIGLAEFGQVAAAAAMAIAFAAGCGLALLKVLKWPVRTYLTQLMHPNTGNMGLPLVLLAFGDAGLALGITYFFVNSVSQYSLGLGIASGSFQPLQLLRQPIIWSLLAVLAVLGWELTVPAWLAATTQILGGIVIPAMLLLLGSSLASLGLADTRRAVAMACARLVIGLASGAAVILILRLDGLAAGVVLLQAAMPAAVFNFIFAERFGREPARVAGVIVASTVLGIVTLPLLVSVALRIAN